MTQPCSFSSPAHPMLVMLMIHDFVSVKQLRKNHVAAKSFQKQTGFNWSKTRCAIIKISNLGQEFNGGTVPIKPVQSQYKGDLRRN